MAKQQAAASDSDCMEGRVLSAGGVRARVADQQGRRFNCPIRETVRRAAAEPRDAVVAGDRVLFRPVEDREGLIESVLPRKTTLSRQRHGRQHTIVANVDQALIVVSAADPPLKPHLIDRFVISAEKGGAKAVICINKADLAPPAELQSVAGVYGRLGYDVIFTSAVQATGLNRLRAVLRDRETVLCGQSGVGKSSLLNALVPGLNLKTAPVGKSSRKGRHTTRRAVLFPLDDGGWLVDTPGIRQMALWDVAPGEVEAFFVELRPLVSHCRFPDCSHTHEENCAVKWAVEQGLISASRYESYVRLLGDD